MTAPLVPPVPFNSPRCWSPVNLAPVRWGLGTRLSPPWTIHGCFSTPPLHTTDPIQRLDSITYIQNQKHPVQPQIQLSRFTHYRTLSIFPFYLYI